MKNDNEAQVLKIGVFSIQVCVPESWTDTQVLEFANKESASGTEHGWEIRKQGNELLKGANERVNCEKRKGFVHVMLDA